MEKVIYALWRDSRMDREEFSRGLREQVAPRLLALGARGLQINVSDAAVDRAAGLVWSATQPVIDGVVHLWVDSAIDSFRKPFDEALRGVAWQIAAYLVTESWPVVNTRHPSEPGERTYGFSQVVFIVRPPRLDPDEWLETWHREQTGPAIECQNNFYYQANIVARPLTHAAPRYDAIVEECLPPEAMDDQNFFYDSDGDPIRAEENKRILLENAQKMCDFDKLDVVVTSQYVFKNWVG
ncbi:hypothetical protein [Sphingosinicella terrae]|uniref:hypothetical protein n=1 Tax=Sphingosinicella terrae TaxID=2172047 RepID=UPI000E0CDEE8|nr:hypothetical protein [Sphingosinicella terrae]